MSSLTVNDGEDLIINDGDFYMGNPTVSGTWRLRKSGEDLVYERYDGTDWSIKQTISN